MTEAADAATSPTEGTPRRAGSAHENQAHGWRLGRGSACLSCDMFEDWSYGLVIQFPMPREWVQFLRNMPPPLAPPRLRAARHAVGTPNCKVCFRPIPSGPAPVGHPPRGDIVSKLNTPDQIGSPAENGRTPHGI